MPDEWQARQATLAILQVSSSKHNAKKITTRVRGPFHQSITAILTEEKREEKQFTKPTHVCVCTRVRPHGRMCWSALYSKEFLSFFLFFFIAVRSLLLQLQRSNYQENCPLQELLYMQHFMCPALIVHRLQKINFSLLLTSCA